MAASKTKVRKTPKGTPHPLAKWDETYYVRAHELARLGKSDGEIMKLLGLNESTWEKWLRKRPALRDAVDRGRGPGGAAETFFDYVHKRLPAALKPLWELLLAHADANSPQEVLDELFHRGHARGSPDAHNRLRQRMWVHAFAHCGFVATEACRIVGVSTQTLTGWVREDRHFRELYAELTTTVKKDFFEGAFVGLVMRGEPSAVLWGAKTQLRDRGYGPPDKTFRHDVSHSGAVTQVTVDLGGVDLEALPAETKRALLDKMSGAGRQLPPKEVEGVEAD